MKIRIQALAPLLAIIGLIVPIGTANANDYGDEVHQNGEVEYYEMIMYYNSIQYGLGSFSDFYYNVNNFGSPAYLFLSSGNGQGQFVKNNAAAAWNTHTYRAGRVFYNSYYNCNYTCDTIAAGYLQDLSPLMKNNNASWLRL